VPTSHRDPTQQTLTNLSTFFISFSSRHLTKRNPLVHTSRLQLTKRNPLVHIAHTQPTCTSIATCSPDFIMQGRQHQHSSFLTHYLQVYLRVEAPFRLFFSQAAHSPRHSPTHSHHAKKRARLVLYVTRWRCEQNKRPRVL
jgi:hypothetical protein